MNLEKLKTVYKIAHHSIKRTFLDYSLPIVVIVTFILNFVLYDSTGLFGKRINIQKTMFRSIYFNIPLWTIYGGYLGNKFFTKELEEKTGSSFLLTPNSRDVLFLGKATAGLFILAMLAFLSFLQFYLSASYWGSLSGLITGWMARYAFLGFISSLYVFFLTACIGMLSKRTLSGMLFTAVYVILSFPLMEIMTGTFKINLGLFLKFLVLPYLSLSVMNYLVGTFGVVKMSIFVVPIFSVGWASLASLFIFKRVKL